MVKSLNTFAVILLAFPFYLAVKGRLAAYINLAKPGTATASATPSPSLAPASSPASPSPTPAPAPSGNAVSLNDMQGITSLFADSSSLFS